MTTKLSCSNCSQSLSEQDKFCVSCGHKIGMLSVRYHGLDALRGISMLLGVVLHAALPYIPDVAAFGLLTKTPHRLYTLYFNSFIFGECPCFLFSPVFSRI